MIPILIFLFPSIETPTTGRLNGISLIYMSSGSFASSPGEIGVHPLDNKIAKTRCGGPTNPCQGSLGMQLKSVFLQGRNIYFIFICEIQITGMRNIIPWKLFTDLFCRNIRTGFGKYKNKWLSSFIP